MLRSCYSSSYLKKNPSYIGCSVCDEWKSFSNFRKWMLQQNFEGRHLDKDILVRGNKIYGPDTCLFVPQEINNLLIVDDRKGIENHVKFPLGVYQVKNGKGYCAKISKYGKKVYLGSFSTPQKAYEVYRKSKGNYILEIASGLQDINDMKLRKALKVWAAHYLDIKSFRKAMQPIHLNPANWHSYSTRDSSSVFAY